MNLTHLSLYRGRDVDIPPPTNHERLQALHDVLKPALWNQVFNFDNNPAPLPERAQVTYK